MYSFLNRYTLLNLEDFFHFNLVSAPEDFYES